MQVKNTQQGPRGLNTEAGPVLVEPGQTVDVEISKAELASASKSGWFEFGAEAEEKKPARRGGKAGEPASEIDKLTDDELKAALQDRGVTVDPEWDRERLVAEAKKLQG